MVGKACDAWLDKKGLKTKSWKEQNNEALNKQKTKVSQESRVWLWQEQSAKRACNAVGELQRPVVTAIEHLPKPPPKNYGSNETNTNDRWGVYPHYPRRFGDNLRNGLNWNTSMKKKKPKLPTNSLEERNMVRHPMPPPTTSHTDKKKQLNKKSCRKSLDTNDLREQGGFSRVTR